MKEVVIYKIVNILNNKIYIGQTRNFTKRKYYHKVSLKNKKSHCRKLQNAWNKYGEDNFIFEIIENCTLENLNEREIYWIDFYDSITNGYNLEKGGKQNKEISEETRKLMSENNPRIWKGKKWSDHNLSKTVYQYTLQGEYIQSFGNACEASEKLNISQKLINSAARGKANRAGSFQWSYMKYNKLEPYKRYTCDNAPHSRPVVMICPNSNTILKSFGSAASAQSFLKKGKNHIAEVCQGKRKHWAGYKWSYVN